MDLTSNFFVLSIYISENLIYIALLFIVGHWSLAKERVKRWEIPFGLNARVIGLDKKK